MLKKSWDAKILDRDYRVTPAEISGAYKIKRYIWDKDSNCNIETFFHIWPKRHTRSDVIEAAEEFLLNTTADY